MLAMEAALAIQKVTAKRGGIAHELAKVIQIALSAPAEILGPVMPQIEDLIDKANGAKHKCAICGKSTGDTYFSWTGGDGIRKRRHVYCSSPHDDTETLRVAGGAA
jgi:hypothetical protein